MSNRRSALLGVPIDNLYLSEVVDRILELIRNCKEPPPPNYICTVNVDFLANCHSLTPYPRYGELLEILRGSSLLTADGMPLVWLSKLLGAGLKERVAGSDLVPYLAQKLAKENRSIFFLGGEDKAVKQAASQLVKYNPGLRIAGIACPKIAIEGEGLQDAVERDEVLIDQINEAKPDLLLISLGNPKQEIWFHRVRNKLKVPAAIGVGGTLNFLTGKVKRAPGWMQQWGLEWLYRLSREPGRLWKRYAYDLGKITYLALPLVTYHTVNRGIFRIFQRSRPAAQKNALLFVSSEKSIAMVPLPRHIHRHNKKELEDQISDAFLHDAVILDFSALFHLDTEGLTLLIDLWTKASAKKEELYALGIKRDTKLLFQLHRVWDLLAPNVCRSEEELISRLEHGIHTDSVYEAYEQKGNTLIINYFGQLDESLNEEAYIEQKRPMMSLKDLTIDLRYCTRIHNGGFSYLLRLKRDVELNGKDFNITGVSRKLRKQFKIAGILSLLD